MDYDILIVGAGPAGLCLARMLSGNGLRIAVVEQQELAAIEKPAFDGREIALTQRSAQLMRQLGLWERIKELDVQALAPLKDARVLNGASTFAMAIVSEHANASELGWFASNYLIRQAAYDCVQDSIAKNCDVTLMIGKKVVQAHSHEHGVRVELDDSTRLHCQLLVAADSRFSSIRRAMGIAADMHDFGRSMMTFMMTHVVPHEHVAWEWFDYGQTLALLPMNDDPISAMPRSSIVLTLPGHAMERLIAMSQEDFSAEMTRRFADRLGPMQLVSSRHTYPLVGVYPRRLVASRFACVGDAAVGMHPVTAHGFNFALLGIATFSELVLCAQANGQDISSASLLHTYERRHRLATKPLYLITQAIARLYTTETLPAQWLRMAALHVGQRFPLFRRAVAASIAGQ